MDVTFDHRYNRIITPNSRLPWADFGSRGIGSANHDGYVKCKLAHGRGYSLIVPDALFLGTAGGQWIQPLSFAPNFLNKYEDEIRCSFSVDISGGNRLIANFTSRDCLASLLDGSELYRCVVQGPGDLADYVTGRSSLTGAAPYLRLYHHTSDDAKAKILTSGEFWGSKWNIQGTKKLKNVAYVYFTPLHEVTHPDDLKLMAMASDGELSFQIDNFQPPPVLTPGWRQTYKEKVLMLPVYRASTLDRTARLEFDIESTLLAPQHLLQHAPSNGFVWYEIASPFIHRVGIEQTASLPFKSQQIRHVDVQAKRFEYVVVGDARTVEGLAAPYDEENTAHVLKIERPAPGSNILEFWFQHGNDDLYSPKNVELQRMELVVGAPAFPPVEED